MTLKMISMEKRLDLEKRNRKPAEITELNLDNSKASEIEGLTEEYENLESLSLINVGLHTLKGFPKLPNLKKLELSDNRISSGLNHLEGCPMLSHLTLSGNKIKDMEAIKPLANLKNLHVLDLFTCEITEIDGYRDAVFKLLPNLKFLDGIDVDGVQCEDELDDDEEDEDDEEYVNGDDDEDEGEYEDEEEEEEEVGLEYLQQDDVEEDDEEYQPKGAAVNANSNDDDQEEFDDEDSGSVDEDSSLSNTDARRGVKRKHEGQDGEEDSSQ